MPGKVLGLAEETPCVDKDTSDTAECECVDAFHMFSIILLFTSNATDSFRHSPKFLAHIHEGRCGA
jgi:hypothetical protein